jgi:2-phosphoglycerate kinase
MYAVIVLKAIAYINNSKRKANGEQVRSEDISKHKNDIFRIVSTLTETDKYEIPKTIKNDLRTFLAMVEKDGLGTSGLSKELGLGTEITFEIFNDRLRNTFGL